MALPKEPRQLMINLMYLVLTALLALNVSNEILNAFKIVDDSIKRSTVNTDNNSLAFYEAFAKEAQDPGSRGEKARPLYAKALQMQAMTDSLVNYIQSVKGVVVTEAGGYSEDNPNELKNPENIDAATQVLVEGRQDGKATKPWGDELKSKITEYRTKAFELIDQSFPPAEASSMKASFAVKLDSVVAGENNPKGDWARGIFYNVPAVGAMTILSKFQNDARNSENQLIQSLYKQVSTGVVFINGYDVSASVNNGYVLAGQKVTGDISLVPITTSSVRPNFSVSSGRVSYDANNIGHWETTAPSEPGLKTVNVSVQVADANGGMVTKTAKMQYMVGSEGASLQLDKMNVFYKGVPNPITVSAAGVNMQDVAVSIPGAEMKSTGLGKYDVDVSNINPNTTVNCVISGKTGDGNSRTFGTFPVRVKRIPDPLPRLGGITSGNLPANVIRGQLGVYCELVGFDFEAKFKVLGMSLYINRKGGGDVQSAVGMVGARFDEKALNFLKNVRPGDKIIIDDISAIGPDPKDRRKLPAISITAI